VPELWYDIEKAYFLDTETGSVVTRFVVFQCGENFERHFETYGEAEAYVTSRLAAVRR